MKNKLLFIILGIFMLGSCQPETPLAEAVAEGKLFIIGGGKRPDSMVKEMISLSGTDSAGYIVVLPMASSEPDTAGWYGRKQFTDRGAGNVTIMNIDDPLLCGEICLDSLRRAALIYITGGDQSKFMDIVLNTPVHSAILDAYRDGAVIAGTSAGAAVMSRRMITGNEFRHAEYTGDFRTIEAANVELREGLGLLEDAIVDQHFIRRMRMNRLISVALENPGTACYGIDEATALVVEDGYARVTGDGQVIRILFNGNAVTNGKGLLGGKGLIIDVLVPGDSVFQKP